MEVGKRTVATMDGDCTIMSRISGGGAIIENESDGNISCRGGAGYWRREDAGIISTTDEAASEGGAIRMDDGITDVDGCNGARTICIR